MTPIRFLSKMPSNLKDETWQVCWNCHNKNELEEAVKSFRTKYGVSPTITVIQKKGAFKYADIWMWNPILKGGSNDKVCKKKRHLGD